MDPLPVRLRPFTESDLVLFDQYANDRELSEPFEWLGFTSSEPFRRRWQEDRLLGSSPYCLAVAAIDGVKNRDTLSDRTIGFHHGGSFFHPV